MKGMGIKMTIRKMLYLGILVVCGVLIVVQLIARRQKGLVAILFRLTGGVVGIFCANTILGMLGGQPVGLNPFSLMLLGSLGAPGFVLLYFMTNLQGLL